MYSYRRHTHTFFPLQLFRYHIDFFFLSMFSISIFMSRCILELSVCLFVCLLVWMSLSVSICMLVFLSVGSSVYLSIYLLIYQYFLLYIYPAFTLFLLQCISTYTYIHTYIHTYLHTYTHTYIPSISRDQLVTSVCPFLFPATEINR